MYKLLLVLVIIIKVCCGARILGIAPIPSYSHQIVYRAIWKELAVRGHDMVILTTDPINDPTLKNYKEIDLHFAYDIMNTKHNVQAVISKTSNIYTIINVFYNALNDVMTQQLAHPQVQALLNNKSEHFDLVMIEYMMPNMFAFAHRFKAPFIGLSSLDSSPTGHDILGNPTHPIIYPDFQLPFTGDLTFFQRVIACGVDLLMKYMVMSWEGASQEIVDTNFGPGYPKIKELMNAVDMLFINVNPITNVNRPLAPATITIGGGIHIQKLKPLPKDLQEYLDNAKNGVVYMSLGSNVKSKDLSPEVLSKLLKVFGELEYSVLWKFEGENLPGKPDNVKIMKWIPQQDVLRHPNIKVFITQGGLQSTEETLYSHVPIIGMPFFGDQQLNVQRLVANGFGLTVDRNTMTSTELKSTILEVINNPKYRLKVKEMALLIRDEPMTGLEKAVWWTEYVLRHKGAQNLKGAGINLPLYQYYRLDVLTFVFVVCAALIAIAYISIKITMKTICKLCTFKKNAKKIKKT